MLQLYRRLCTSSTFQRCSQRLASTNPYSSDWVSPSLQQHLDQFVASHPKPPSICLIGDPHLRRSNEAVLNLQDGFVQAAKLRLHQALAEFRRQNGFGRGISACQIGVNLRMIALNLGYGPLTMINPSIIWSSPEKITMWDDCMSIPKIMVKKQRAKSISIVYTDDNGKEQKWNEIETSVSELLQHEMDHLEGILNIDQPHRDSRKKGDGESVISMDEYRTRKEYFDGQVDYAIVPTV